MYTRKQALAIARQIRTCPPPEIRNNPKYAGENSLHLAKCPFCSTGRSMELDACHILAQGFKQHSQVTDLAISPGRIMNIDPTFSCWRNNDYYTGPVVVILKIQEKPVDTVLVAQTWHDIYLASPGDLVVPEPSGQQGPEKLFIETWNIYTLRKNLLGECRGDVSEKIVQATLEMNENPGFLPAWARRPMPLGKEDPRLSFQQLEIKTSTIFTDLSADQPAAITEQKNLYISGPVDKLMEKIKALMDGISWSWTPETIQTCFAAIGFAPESIPLSAAGRDQKEIIAAYFKIKEGNVKAVKPVSCIILHENILPEQFTVTGKILNLPHGVNAGSFRCYLENKVRKTLFSGQWTWDENSRYFLARFKKTLEPGDRISIVIMDHANG